MNDIYDILCSSDVVQSINDNFDCLLNLIPEISKMIKFDQMNPEHHLTLWEHTLLALSMSKNDFDIRLVLLLHDIGKPCMYQEVKGIRHYRNHADKSAEISYNILKSLNFNDEYIDKICLFIKNHDTLITDELISGNYEYTIKLYEIQKCDALAHHPDKLEKRKQYLKKIKNKLDFKN